jgi:hypothetical protein
MPAIWCTHTVSLAKIIHLADQQMFSWILLFFHNVSILLYSSLFYTLLYFSHPMIILLKCLHHFSFVTKSIFWFHTSVHWRGCMQPLPVGIWYQRVLNDLQRTRLSRPSPVSKLDRRHAERLRKRDNFLTREWGRGWGRSQIKRRRESLVLKKSFNVFSLLDIH